MSTNNIGAKVNDIVKVVSGTRVDTTIGRLYPVTEVGPDWVMILDDKNQENCCSTAIVQVVGTIRPGPKDIQGNEVKVGDTIAYAFAGAQSHHLALFEVQSINGPVALCRAKSDGAVINLGVFEERAIIIK